MRVYWAAPVFTQVQRAWNRTMANCLRRTVPNLCIILPQDFRPQGRFNDPRTYGEIFRRCLDGIRGCDALVAVLDGPDADSGVAFEMGVAHTLGKPIIGVRTDYRPGPEHGVNLLCSRACAYMAREFSFQEDPAAVAAAIGRRLRALAKKGKAT